MQRRWWGLTLAAALLHAPQVYGSPADHVATRIRTADPTTRRLVAEGYERSATFRGLVDRLDALKWTVFIQLGPCPNSRAAGCLLHIIGRWESEPALRVQIDPQRLHRLDRRLSVIAHELQHALEVAEGNISDSREITKLFARIGRVAGSTPRGLAYETEAAAQMGHRVREELAKHPKP